MHLLLKQTVPYVSSLQSPSPPPHIIPRPPPDQSLLLHPTTRAASLIRYLTWLRPERPEESTGEQPAVLLNVLVQRADHLYYAVVTPAGGGHASPLGEEKPGRGEGERGRVRRDGAVTPGGGGGSSDSQRESVEDSLGEAIRRDKRRRSNSGVSLYSLSPHIVCNEGA